MLLDPINAKKLFEDIIYIIETINDIYDDSTI